jgi:hypothetical protein
MSNIKKYLLLFSLLSSVVDYAHSEETTSIKTSSSNIVAAPVDDSKPDLASSEPSPKAAVTAEASVDMPMNTQVAVLPARTPVKFALSGPVSSKTAVAGEQFKLVVVADIAQNGVVLIPKGTQAVGEVIHASKAGGLGKAGELLVTVRYIDLNGQKIKMRSFQPFQGNNQSSSVAAMSSVPYLGLFAGFIQGGNIEMPAQTLVQALIATETVINPAKQSVPVVIESTENKSLTTNNETGESK